MLGNIIALMFLGTDFAYLHIGGKCVSKVNKCLECVLEVLNYFLKQLSLICRKITSRGLHITLYRKLINSGSNKHIVHFILKLYYYYVPFYTRKFCCFVSATFLGSLFIPTPRAPIFQFSPKNSGKRRDFGNEIDASSHFFQYLQFAQKMLQLQRITTCASMIVISRYLLNPLHRDINMHFLHTAL